MGIVEFDSRGVTSLDGVWDFIPGDGAPPDPDAPAPETIAVPGLWEAQGHLELDGPAWYRRISGAILRSFASASATR